MSNFDYESSSIVPGGIHAFDGVTQADRTKEMEGTEPVLGDEASKQAYNEKVLSILSAMAIEETPEDLLATAA